MAEWYERDYQGQKGIRFQIRKALFRGDYERAATVYFQHHIREYCDLRTYSTGSKGRLQEAQEEAPRFREVARALQHHVRRADTVWTYNAAFDRRLLIQTAELAGTSAAKKALRQAEWRDLMDRATDHLGQDARVSLAEATERLGAGPEEGALHRAKGDAALAWRVWKRLGAPAFSEVRE